MLVGHLFKKYFLCTTSHRNAFDTHSTKHKKYRIEPKIQRCRCAWSGHWPSVRITPWLAIIERRKLGGVVHWHCLLLLGRYIFFGFWASGCRLQPGAGLVWASQLMFYISATLFLSRFSARLFSPASPFLPPQLFPFFAHFTRLLLPLFLKLTSVGRRRNINGPKWKRGGDSLRRLIVRLLTFNLHPATKTAAGWKQCWVEKKRSELNWNWENWTAWSFKMPSSV